MNSSWAVIDRETYLLVVPWDNDADAHREPSWYGAETRLD